MEENKKISITGKILIILFLLIMFTGRNIISGLKWGFIVLFFLIPFCDIIINKKKMCITKITGIWIFIALYVILGLVYSYSSKTSLMYIAILVIGILFLTYKIDKQIFLEFIKIAKVICIVYALSNIFSAVIPNFIPRFFSFFVNNLNPIYIELAGNNYSGLAGEKAVSAFIINIGIGIIYAQMLVRGKITKKDAIILLILFGGLFLTGKRTLTLIPLLLLFIMYICSSEKNKIVKLIKISSLVLIGIIVLLIVFPSTMHVVERLLSSGDSGRNELWDICIQMFEDSPAIGQGLGTFNQYSYDVGYRNYGEMWTFEAHNIYFQILGELGIIGFTLIIFAFIYGLIISIKLLRDTQIKKNKKYKFLIYISLYTQLLFLVYGLTGNTFYYWHQLFVYMMALSIINSVIYFKNKTEENCSDKKVKK